MNETTTDHDKDEPTVPTAEAGSPDPFEESGQSGSSGEEDSPDPSEEKETSDGTPSRSESKYERQCPRCGHRFYGEKVCPRCGYNGYFPMNEQQMRKIKWILYPVALIAAGLAYYFLVVRSGS